MAISIFDERLKHLAILAERRKLNYWPVSEEVFIVSSSRTGISPYKLTLKGEEIDCPCAAGKSGLACTHASIIVEHRFPSIALKWAEIDSREFHSKRLAIEKGEVSKRELNRYRRAYRDSLSVEQKRAA